MCEGNIEISVISALRQWDQVIMGPRLAGDPFLAQMTDPIVADGKYFQANGFYDRGIVDTRAACGIKDLGFLRMRFRPFIRSFVGRSRMRHIICGIFR